MDSPKRNILDKTIALFSPEKAARRDAFKAIAGSKRFAKGIQNLVKASPFYRGNRKGRSLGEWQTDSGTANEHIAESLVDLRNDSNDLVANNSIAAGAISTYVTNVVGTGLQLSPNIDNEYLKLSEEQAEEWQQSVEREWALFCKTCDLTRTKTFVEVTGLVFRSYLTNGDVFVNLPMIKRPGIVYETTLNLIEGHRISSKNEMLEGDRLVMGVELDEYGAPSGYQYSTESGVGKTKTWRRLKAFDDHGNPLVLHIFKKMRVDQNRGIPLLAPIIETIKKIDTYAQAEVDAAVLNAFFTVFIKKKSTDDTSALDVVSKMGGETGAKSSDDDLVLGSATIVELYDDEEGIELADPNRPNVNFGNFFDNFLGQVAMGINMPKEVLLKAFQSSYSASKGAIIEATKVFDECERFLVDSFCQQVYEAFLFEAVAKGRISAPGFMTDPLIKQAYCESEWIGPGQNELDPGKGAKAAALRMENNTSNEMIETARTGRNFRKVQRGKKRAELIKKQQNFEVQETETEV